MKASTAVVIWLSTILSVGCATQSQIQRGDLSRLKRFGVVSVIGDEFTRNYTGITVFGNELERKDVLAWGLDASYASQLGETAAALFGGVYVRGRYARERFVAVNGNVYSGGGPPHWEKIIEAIQLYCRENSLDAVLVVAKHNSQLPGTPMQLHSVGMQARPTWAVLYVSAQVGVLDCDTGRPRAVAVLSEGRGVFADPFVLRDFSRERGALSLEHWDAATEIEVRDRMTTLPYGAWSQTLTRMIAEQL